MVVARPCGGRCVPRAVSRLSDKQRVGTHDAVPGAQHPQKPEVFKWEKSMDDFSHGQLGLAHTRGPPPIDLQWITGLLLLQSPFGFEPVDPTGFIWLIGNVDDLIRIAGHVE